MNLLGKNLIFLVAFLFVFLNIYSRLLFADNKQDAQGNNCNDVISDDDGNNFDIIASEELAVKLAGIISQDPRKIGARPSDLRHLTGDVAELRHKLVKSPLKTDQELLQNSFKWLKAADAFIAEREDGGENPPNRGGVFILGVSRLNEALLGDNSADVQKKAQEDFRNKRRIEVAPILARRNFDLKASKSTAAHIARIIALNVNDIGGKLNNIEKLIKNLKALILSLEPSPLETDQELISQAKVWIHNAELYINSLANKGHSLNLNGGFILGVTPLGHGRLLSRKETSKQRNFEKAILEKRQSEINNRDNQGETTDD